MPWPQPRWLVAVSCLHMRLLTFAAPFLVLASDLDSASAAEVHRVAAEASSTIASTCLLACSHSAVVVGKYNLFCVTSMPAQDAALQSGLCLHEQQEYLAHEVLDERLPAIQMAFCAAVGRVTSLASLSTCERFRGEPCRDMRCTADICSMCVL